VSNGVTNPVTLQVWSTAIGTCYQSNCRSSRWTSNQTWSNREKNKVKSDMNVGFERIDDELKLNGWMLSVLSIVIKSFF